MGVDKYLYYKEECVANLGRAYHFNPDPEDVLNRLKLRLYSTREPDEFLDLLEAITDAHEAKARSDLIDSIMEDGALTVRDE